MSFGFREDFDWENRFMIKDYIGDYLVSTVDLGINHSFDETPLYYETMIFKIENGKVNYSDIYCDRYTTKEQALKGHKEAIKWLESEK